MGTERRPWSDESGNLGLESKELIDVPTLEGQETFDWDGEWILDLKWAPVDSDGWQYFNQVWGSPHSGREIGSFTRRRKWKRVMKVKDEILSSPKSGESNATLGDQ